MNNAEEISVINKLVLQQIGLLEAISDCHKLKKELIGQAIIVLKAIAIKSNGIYKLEKEFLDSASDESIELNINTLDDGNVHLEIKEAGSEN